MTQNLKNAIIATLVAGILLTPIFGLGLVRQGVSMAIVPDWSIVLIGMAIVFVVQLLKPLVFKGNKASPAKNCVRTGMPSLGRRPCSACLP